MSVPDRETMLRYIERAAEVRLTFTSGERMVRDGSLPTSGIVERAVFTKLLESDGWYAVVTICGSDPDRIVFYSIAEGGYHPRLTSVEPLEPARNAADPAQVEPTP